MNKVTCIKNENYTTISNVFLRDMGLSLKAKGFLAIVMALPKDWDFSINGITKIIKEGKTSIYSTIDELKERGYCKVETIRNDKGVIMGNDYTFYEEPHQDQPYLENLNMDNKTQIKKEDKQVCNQQSKEDKEKELKEKSSDAFEECWIAYKRKGLKKKSKEYWNKLTDKEKVSVLPHIKAYVASREVNYQKDFERYLRDKIFLTVVFKNSQIVYDPTKFDSQTYSPQGRTIWFNEETKSYWSDDNFYYGTISDGYTDDDRPDGARLVLNNARGELTWDSNNKKWVKK